VLFVRSFVETNISQKNVAACLGAVELLMTHFIANLLLNVTMEEV